MEIPGVGFAVAPKDDCPHIEDLKIPEEFVEQADKYFHTPCQECGDSAENWMCIACGYVGCSRYVSGHFRQHGDKEAEVCHRLGISFSDLST